MRKKFILNNSLRGYPVGYKIRLTVDKTGKPVDRYWGSRFEDAKTDNCICVFKEAQKEIKKETKKEVKVESEYTKEVRGKRSCG